VAEHDQARRHRLRRADRLEALLFSTPSQVFALLDAARDTGVLPMLEHGDCPYTCLYKGQAAATYKHYAPYLVQLHRDAQVTDRLLQDAWGSSVVCFLGTSREPADLLHHLRHFLYATLPDGRQAYFRFYDPRVLRSFLPTSSGAQLDDFLRDAIDWFVMESTDPDEARVYSRIAGAREFEARLATDTVPLMREETAP
jgi:hypothetical protein